MLGNLRLVLLQHKKLLAVFVLVVFLPSIILAYFGVRAIRNERYKLQQLNLEQQRGLIRILKAEVQSLLDREMASVREFSTSRALADGDHRSLSKWVFRRIQDKSVLGRIAVWTREGVVWFPGAIERPPTSGVPRVPAEWKRLQPEIDAAENCEFRLRNVSEAVALYERILQRAVDDDVRAWIQSRIARCAVKQQNFKRAVNAYRSLIEKFPRSVTESGRPLEIVSRMEMLDALRAAGDLKAFFQESLQTLKRLEQNFWSMNGAQAGLYATQLLQGIDAVLKACAPVEVPYDFESRVDELRKPLGQKMEMERMAEAVRRDLLPGVGNKRKRSAGEDPGVQKGVLEFEGKDVLALLASADGTKSGSVEEYLGSLVRIDDLSESLDTLLAQNGAPGLSVLFRSTLLERIVYGLQPPAGLTPALTDMFPENFPPWKIEVFLDDVRGGGIPLYKNIFFWTILALLVIVIFGSGLMIRMIVQEVNLFNLKSEFIASVSHEFKTPLTAMGAILERLLSQEVDDPRKTREYYRFLSHDADKLKRLVKNILDFTKIEDRKREYKRTTIDVVRLVRQEIDDFQKENEPAGFRADVKVEGDIPPVVADEEALRQALHNILDNAAKFSGRRKDIEVTVVRRGDGLEIVVRDQGVGIPENEQKKVFEKFFRGKMASSVSPTGTGLGLTLVKHIMDAHGGDVIIRSQPGEGSRVSLVLPLGKETG